jgi:hypothetical protein
MQRCFRHTRSNFCTNAVKANDVKWGPVIVTNGTYRGRVGDLDDEDWDENGHVGFVYFGTIHMYRSRGIIAIRHLRHATTNDLLKRSNALSHLLCDDELPDDELVDAFHEYHYIYRQLGGRWLKARERRKDGIQVFISHSSKDAQLARWIAVDIASHGFRPWLDEWEITAGESIPKRISEGLEECQAMIVALSPEAVQSGWVEREWHTKYWDEIEQRRVCLIPALLKPCTVPLLLRPRKYANFANSFEVGIEETLEALRKLSARTTPAKRANKSPRRKRTDG